MDTFGSIALELFPQIFSADGFPYAYLGRAVRVVGIAIVLLQYLACRTSYSSFHLIGPDGENHDESYDENYDKNDDDNCDENYDKIIITRIMIRIFMRIIMRILMRDLMR